MKEKQFGRCQKNKNPAKCLTEKCSTFNRYNNGDLPCFYYRPENRGFEGDFRKLGGVKIRRQYFNWPLGLYVYVAPMVILLCAGTVKGEHGSNFELIMNLLKGLYAFFIFLIPPIILSLLNSFFFGKCVCVMNKEGIYCNQRFVKWNEIDCLEFHPRVPYRFNFEYSYVKILCKNDEIFIPHAPYLLLLRAKLLSPGIHCRFDKSGFILAAILFGIITVGFSLIIWFS